MVVSDASVACCDVAVDVVALGVVAGPAAAGASPLPHAMANAITASLTRGTLTRVVSRRLLIIYFGAPRKSSVALDVMHFTCYVQCFVARDF